MKVMDLISSEILFSSEGLVSLSGCTRGQQGNFLAVLLTLSLASRVGARGGRVWHGTTDIAQDLAWLSFLTRAPRKA